MLSGVHLWTLALTSACAGVAGENAVPSLFRLGSGAVVPSTQRGQDPRPAKVYQPKDIQMSRQPPTLPRAQRVLICCMPLAVSLILLLMVHPSGAGHVTHARDWNYRTPPYWSPDNEHVYSFRAYMVDISQWVMLTDLQPHQQAAAMVMRLGGAAREMGRMISPQEMFHGGALEPGGEVVDPVTYLLGSLHSRFSPLEEESSVTALCEMLAFQRRHGESVNALMVRYEVVRQRAALEGQFVMNVPGCSLQILRACNVSPQHLHILLQPFQGRLPTTDAQFNQLCTQLRRYGRISENAPGNIASALHGPPRQARPGAYHAQTHLQLRDAYERSGSSRGSAHFLGATQDGQYDEGDPLAQYLLQADPTDDPFAQWAGNQQQEPDACHAQAGSSGGANPS